MGLLNLFRFGELSKTASNEYFAFRLNELIRNNSIKKYDYVMQFIDKFYKYNPKYRKDLKFKITPEIKVLCQRAKLLKYKYDSQWLTDVISSSVLN